MSVLEYLDPYVTYAKTCTTWHISPLQKFQSHWLFSFLFMFKLSFLKEVLAVKKFCVYHVKVIHDQKRPGSKRRRIWLYIDYWRLWARMFMDCWNYGTQNYFCSKDDIVMPEFRFSLTLISPYKDKMDKICVWENPCSAIFHALNTFFKRLKPILVFL